MIYIIGAGLSGLLIANILKQYNPAILESQNFLPDNHSALLRFRSRAIEEITGIKLQKVEVQKAIYANGELYIQSDLRLQNAYSLKVSGGVYPRSNLNIDDCIRYLPPHDFVDQLAQNVEKIRFGEYVSFDRIVEMWNQGDIIISTIPMHALMEQADWKDIPDFHYKLIHTVTGLICNPDCNVNQTIYFSDPHNPLYRCSIVGNRFIAEFVSCCKESTDMRLIMEDHLEQLFPECFGIKNGVLAEIEIHTQKYGKISPIDENIRRQFIYTMSANYNLYSFGRFATWRQLLLEDLIRDAKVIERLFTQKNKLFTNNLLQVKQ